MGTKPSPRRTRVTGFTGEAAPTTKGNGLTVSMNTCCLFSAAASGIEKVDLGKRLLLTVLDAVYVVTGRWPSQRVEPPSTARTWPVM